MSTELNNESLETTQEAPDEIKETQGSYTPSQEATPATHVRPSSDDGLAPTPEKKKHSGPGIASFIMALLSGIVFIFGIITSISATAGLTDPNALLMLEGNASLMTTLMIAGVLMLLAGGLNLVGLILGIVGLVIKNRKKVFAVIGTIMNVIPVLLLVVLFIIGLSLQNAIL